MSIPSSQVNRIPPHDRFNKTIQDNAWMDNVERFINAGYFSPPGPYANDAAAEAANVPIKAMYYKPDGSVWVRLV